ncbi:MAG: hypothetical protein JXA99_06865 [Candidatus Lokiarchaeota archaeon]|nr:hypothetical protein [Candidatus Lokiarchaeota archaeon]
MSDLEISKDIKKRIELEAYYLSKKNLTYNELCWMLAEKIIQSQREQVGRIAKAKIQEKAEEIFNHSYKYEDLCWQIAELIVKDETK